MSAHKNGRPATATHHDKVSGGAGYRSDRFVLDVQPGRKAPDLTKWANTIRLMREQDARTHADIRDLFAVAQRDTFWRVNILCPDKLRAKWDDVDLRLRGSRAPAASIYPELKPMDPPECKPT